MGDHLQDTIYACIHREHIHMYPKIFFSINGNVEYRSSDNYTLLVINIQYITNGESLECSDSDN